MEPGLRELLSGCGSSIEFTGQADTLRQCDVVFISRDVPTDKDNRSDLAPLHSLIDQLPALPTSATLVILSQVSPGFTRKLAASFRGLDNTPVSLFYQVETLIFGRAVERALHPAFFILGCDKPRAKLPEPYAKLLGSFACPVFQMRYESAELAKISINMCLMSSVYVTNVMAEVCEAVGADWSEIVPALKLDKRIGPYAYLAPGLGIAGGNLERDLTTVRTLAKEFGTDAEGLDAWASNSRHRRDWALRLLHSHVTSRHRDPVIAIWGLAYKPGTTSTKNSPALSLIDALQRFSLRIFDPYVFWGDEGPGKAVCAKSALDACDGVDALVVMTPWPEFATVDLSSVER